MLKLKNNEYQIKYTQIDIRERMYQGDSVVTLIIHTEFYPEVYNDSIIYGDIEINVDLKDIFSLKDLEDKQYHGDIGKVSFSICNQGIWESSCISQFSISFGKIQNRMLDIKLESCECYLEDKGRLVSLYTTSNQELDKVFDLDSFYHFDIKKEIGKSSISRYFVK